MTQMREAEIENLNVTVLHDKQILGLEVAMDDAFLVRRGEPMRDL